MDDIEKEHEAVKHATETGRLMSEFLEKYDQENKRLWVALLALVAAFVVIAGCMVYTVRNIQQITDEAVWKALQSAAEVTVTTTTQTVEGDSATINNVDGEQYNDSAQKAGE